MQNAVQEFSVSRVIQTARSLLLPSPIPSAPPRGQQARELDIGSFHNDHPGWKLTPASLLAAFVQAEQGDPRRQCRMFNDIVSNDCTLASLLFQRRQSVAGKARVINATNETRQSMVAAKVLSTVAQEVIGTKTVEHLLGFNKYGFAASEIIWTVRRVNGRQWVVPQYFLNVPADRFLIGDPLVPNGRVDELRLVVSQYARSGEALESGKWIVLDRAEPNLAQCALMRVAAWPAMGKRFAFRDWLIFSEKFGIPLAVVKYDDNRDDEKSKQVATEIVRNIGGDGGAVIPKAQKGMYATNPA